LELKITVGLDDDTRRFIRELFVCDLRGTLEVSCALEAIDGKLTSVLTNQEEMKRMNQETTDLLKRIDDATNKVADKLQALIDKAAAAGSVTAAEVDAALSPLVTHLEAVAADPANPVPLAVP